MSDEQTCRVTAITINLPDDVDDSIEIYYDTTIHDGEYFDDAEDIGEAMTKPTSSGRALVASVGVRRRG